MEKLTQDIFDIICDRLAEGRSLKAICRDEDIPVSDMTVRRRVMKSPEWTSQYTSARDLGVDAMVEEMLDIAHDGTNDWVEKERKDGSTYLGLDTEHVQRSRLRTDTLKWYTSKIAPKRYGDRVQTDITSSDGTLKSMSQDQIAHKLTQIIEAAQKRAEAAKNAPEPEAETEEDDCLW